MHVYKCMWHCRRCTKINGVRKLANARVRNIYMYRNFCDLQLCKFQSSRSTYECCHLLERNDLIDRWNIFDSRRSCKKLNITWVSKNPRAWWILPKGRTWKCQCLLALSTTNHNLFHHHVQAHRHYCIVVMWIEWNMRDLSVALKNHEKFSRPYAFWRYCDESCAFRDRLGKSPISFQHTSRWTLLHSKMFHPDRIHQW